MLLGLEKLGLIKQMPYFIDNKKDINGKIIQADSRGIVLTQYGYTFIDCLEHPNK